MENQIDSVRVLVVLPMYGGSLPIGRYVADALKDEGHRVDTFEAPDFFSAFSALKSLKIPTDRLEQLESGFLNTVSQAIHAKVDAFEPDLVLCLAQAPLNRVTLRKLERDGVTTAMWFVEDHAVFPYWRAFAPCYDFFFVIQKEPLLEKLRAEGANGFYLPLAALPSFHRPVELSSADRQRFGAEVSFLGAGYPNRRMAFRQLGLNGFKIWGSDWDGETVLAPYVQERGARIAPDDAVRIFNATAVNLNLHSSVRPEPLVSGGDFVNPRTFELAACGAFQLVDTRTLMPELFTQDELATFSTMDELRERIAWYLAHPEERHQMAEKARNRVLAEHTYQHRMRNMLSIIAAGRPEWPRRRRHASLPEGLPQALHADVMELLKRLELPAEAPFTELVSALRQQSGVLSPLETSLLFLDEWQKQYAR